LSLLVGGIKYPDSTPIAAEPITVKMVVKPSIMPDIRGLFISLSKLNL
jgi:hypothetical protein